MSHSLEFWIVICLNDLDFYLPNCEEDGIYRVFLVL